jgi:hypothetical protein
MSYYLAAADLYHQWGCKYKAHKAVTDADAIRVELTPISSRPVTPRRRSSLSNTGMEYTTSRLDVRTGLSQEPNLSYLKVRMALAMY